MVYAAAASAGEAIKRAVESDATEGEIDTAGLLGTLPGLIEPFLGPGKAIDKILPESVETIFTTKVGEAIAKNVLDKGGKATMAGVGEAIEEAAQETMQNVIGKTVYDADIDLFEGTKSRGNRI